MQKVETHLVLIFAWSKNIVIDFTWDIPSCFCIFGMKLNIGVQYGHLFKL